MKVFMLALAAGVSVAATASAATSGYWRHEEGPAGALIAAGPDKVLDSSGTDSHMQTFDPTFTSATYSSTVSPLPLRSGLANTLSLDFGPGGDDAGQNDDNFTTAAKPISSQLFNAITVEVAFKMDAIGGFQAIMGKDGSPIAGPVPPFKVLVRADSFPGPLDTPRPGTGAANQLFVEWIDGDGDINYLAGGQSITTANWNHVAVTIDATNAALYVATETGPYQLLDSFSGDFAGPGGNVIIAEPLGWTIGRGAFGNSPADFSNSLIDEGRISNTVLAPNEFLFVAVPEPSTAALILGALGLVGVLRRRAA